MTDWEIFQVLGFTILYLGALCWIVSGILRFLDDDRL